MPLPYVSPMTPDDLDELMPIERHCFQDPWSRRMYLIDLTQNDLSTYLVLRPTLGLRPVEAGARDAATVPPILAYGGFWLMAGEAHIATLASHPDWRGCGLGLWLLLALLDAAAARGAMTSTLEVRVSNVAARKLYEKLGYEMAGMRVRYYRDGEDGLILTTPELQSPPVQERLAAARVDALTRLQCCFGAETHTAAGGQRL